MQSLGAVGIVQLSLLVSGVVTARGLGPAGRGNMAVILALPSVVMNLVCVGFPSALTYFVARRSEAWIQITKRIAGAAAVQVCLGLLVLFGLNVYFLSSKPAATYSAGLLVLTSFPLMMFQYYVAHIVQGLGDIRWVNILRVTGPSLYSLGVLAVSVVGLTVIRCSVVWVATQILAASAAAFHLARRKRRATTAQEASERTPVLPSVKSISRFALSGFLAQISPIESFRLDTLVVAAIFPARIIGYYSVANSITNVPLFAADALSVVAYPHVASEDGGRARTATRRYMKIGVAVTGLTAGVSAIAIPFALPLLFGRAYVPAISTAELLACAAAVLGLRRLGNDLLRGMGKPALSTQLEVITLAVFAGCLLFLAPVSEGRGVAASLIVAAGVGVALFGRMVRRRNSGEDVPQLVSRSSD